MNKNNNKRKLNICNALIVTLAMSGAVQADSMLVGVKSINKLPEAGFNLNRFYIGKVDNNLAQIKGVGRSGCIYFGEYHLNNKSHYIEVHKEVCGDYSFSLANIYAFPKENISKILVDGSYIDTGELYLFTNKKPVYNK